MKKNYINPEIEVVMLLTDDILSASKDDELYVGGSDLFE